MERPPMNDKQRLAKVAKLAGVAKDLHEKMGAVLEEIDELLAGGAGIGAKLKALEAAFDEAWCARYAPGQRDRYVWVYKQDVPQLKRLIKMLGVEETSARAVRYIMSEDPFFVRGRHGFGLFVRSINQWARAAEAPAGEADDDVADELQRTAERRRLLHQ
jgi:hypothetical protein